MRGHARAVATLLLLVTFGVGALTGMALEEALGIDWFEFLDEDSDDPGGPLLDGLGLTREQAARADEILDRQEDRLEEYWESRLPEIQVMLDRSYAEIRGLLTPGQREEFERRVRELRGRVPAEVRD